MLGYLDEIESDLSRFHRVAEPMSLPSSRYFRLARLLPAYDGALLNALRRDVAAEEVHPAPSPSAPTNMNVASDGIPTFSGSTLAAISETGGGDFPGIEFTGG